MEGFNFDDNEMNAEKPNSTLSFSSGLQQIKKLFRFIEICLVLVLLTWTSRHLPSAVRISGEYFRQLVTVVLSHLFIFFISNIIVLTLFFKSRALFLQHHSENLTEETDFYEEFVDAATGRICPPPEEIVYEDKRTILEVRKVKVNRRSQSEKFRINDGGGCVKQLRRSETERQRRVAAEDELSNEEFQKAIDEFIAKQIKFHLEEKMAIVVHGSN